MLKLYNTLSRKIESFKPIHPPEVGFYSCGPTVYDFQHIGNYRTYVGNDLLQRVLMLNGYQVRRVMNITDVGHLTSNADTGEDKLEKGAKREGKSVWEIAQFYTKDFFENLKQLSVITPGVICKATDHIKEMIDLIGELEKKGFTYQIEDGIYFNTAKLKDYGKLAKLDKKGLLAGARVEPVPGKKNSTDFALWKFSPKETKRQMEWKSPWGTGFPGWHIECSAMAMKYLGETFDIHSGGIDHIPIHHTNEIAQSEAATGKPFAKYWVHFAHLLVEREKMSKSLGNFYTRQDLQKKGFDMLSLRYLYLNTHYRTTMNFTWEALSGARRALERLKEKITEWQEAGKIALSEEEKYTTEFLQSINDDLNLPQALSVVWQMVDDKKLAPGEKIVNIKKFDEVFGLDLLTFSKTEIPQTVKELVKKREQVRKAKKWIESDRLRNEIEKMGYDVEDTKTQTTIKKK
ncbi:cysteine--tRNA ligase [Candidatus Microgenomates bacterium]|nr:cysteine--tRNA ligase [Candidatus Microgenomates bacterium]